MKEEGSSMQLEILVALGLLGAALLFSYTLPQPSTQPVEQSPTADYFEDFMAIANTQIDWNAVAQEMVTNSDYFGADSTLKNLATAAFPDGGIRLRIDTGNGYRFQQNTIGFDPDQVRDSDWIPVIPGWGAHDGEATGNRVSIPGNPNYKGGLFNGAFELIQGLGQTVTSCGTRGPAEVDPTPGPADNSDCIQGSDYSSWVSHLTSGTAAPTGVLPGTYQFTYRVQGCTLLPPSCTNSYENQYFLVTQLEYQALGITPTGNLAYRLEIAAHA